MILGRVVGNVWATRKHGRLGRHKLLIVRPYGYYNPTHQAEQLVAVDTLDAGVGDDVVVCLGAPARWSLGDVNLPVDASVLGIVDGCELAREAFEPGDGRGRRADGRQGPRPLRFIGGAQPQKVSWR